MNIKMGQVFKKPEDETSNGSMNRRVTTAALDYGALKIFRSR